MKTVDIKNTFIGLFDEKGIFNGIGHNENYFDLGISSLTIVEMQVKVESLLKINVDTSKLMTLSTINDWVKIYSEENG